MRILVIGGRGFWGGHIAKGLAAVRGLDVVLGSRSGSGSARFDISDPSTFGVLAEYDCAIDAADTTDYDPLPMLEHALANGRTVIETSADPSTLERIYHAIRKRGGEGTSSGRVILGMGFMPGVTNLLARSLVEKGIKPERLELGVRSSSFAGGGRGMVALMVRTLLHSAVRYEGGQRVEEGPVNPGIVMPFLSGDYQTIRIGLPEAPMLHWSTGAPTTATYMAPKPAFMRHTAKLLAAVAPTSESARKAFYSTLLRSFTFQRATLLRDRPTAVEVTAVRDRLGDEVRGAKFSCMRVNRGVEAGAFAIAAIVEAINLGHSVPTGLHVPEEVFQLQPILDAAARLARGEVRFELSAS